MSSGGIWWAECFPQWQQPAPERCPTSGDVASPTSDTQPDDDDETWELRNMQ